MRKIVRTGAAFGIGLAVVLLAGGRRGPYEGRPVGLASQQLLAEHEVILEVLGAAQAEAQQIQRGRPIDENRVRDILDFSRNFTDRCHHGKEELYYFPAAQAYVGPRLYGIVGEFEIEHAFARSIIAELTYLLNGNADDVSKRIAERLSVYASLLRNHIQKENERLYQRTPGILPATEEQALLLGFDEIENTLALEYGADFHERFRRLAQEMGQSRLQ
jgi:hemerythrin-like domain-containing protein